MAFQCLALLRRGAIPWLSPLLHARRWPPRQLASQAGLLEGNATLCARFRDHQQLADEELPFDVPPTALEQVRESESICFVTRAFLCLSSHTHVQCLPSEKHSCRHSQR